MIRVPSLSILVSLVLLASSLSAAPTVVSTSPLRNTRSALPSTDIVVGFNTAVDVTSFNSMTFKVFGHWSGVAQGSLTFESGNTQVRFTPNRPFSAGEYVTVNLSKGIRDLASDSMDFGYAWMFWVKPSPGNLDFTEIAQVPVRMTGEGHIQTYGAYGGDFNGDGWLDLATVNEITVDVRIFLNDSTGMYDTSEVFDLPNGSVPSPNDGTDLNNDGKIDLVVGNAGNDQVTLMYGDGAGGFDSLISRESGDGPRAVTMLDLDGDGDMDIVTANRTQGNATIFKNNGDGSFAPSTNFDAGGSGETAAAAADANNDGIMDVFIGSYNSQEMALFLGDGNGGLTFSSEVAVGGNPWMIAVGDMNGDGNMDVVSANSGWNTASVIFGNGAGGMSAATTYPVGSFSIAIDVGDIDGDGDLDLVTSNFSGSDWTLYENNGSGVLINQRSFDASTAGSCATLHDRDNDGDLDMTGIDEMDDIIFLFENTGALIPPAIPTLVNPLDEATIPPIDIDLIWNPSSGTGTYHVQVSTDSLFGSTVVNDSTVTDTSRTVGAIPADVTYFWRVSAKNGVGGSGWSVVRRFTTTSQVTQAYFFESAWNLVSVPLSVVDAATDTLFPTASSEAYAYVSGYVQRDTLDNGTGYWLKFPTGGNVSITGSPITSDTIAVVVGWNIIGTITDTVSTSSILQIPSGIVQSSFYGFGSTGYAPSNLLIPSRGYWVKVSQAGQLVLDAGSAAIATKPR
ncbi:MAG: FG-GAP-like repeat-containing protein [Bacteroidota bacterium]